MKIIQNIFLFNIQELLESKWTAYLGQNNSKD